MLAVNIVMLLGCIACKIFGIMNLADRGGSKALGFVLLFGGILGLVFSIGTLYQ